MTSTVSWLDASAEEQRRVREIVQLFSQRETQDELGGRRLVVLFGDALFPGTSVLHTRARYLLFIPWLAQAAATKKDPAGQFDWLERVMIKAFLDDDTVPETDRLVGLIGREAGPKVRQLPSSAYWTALKEWGVLAVPGTIADTLHRMRTWDQREADGADELVERRIGVWDPGVGNPPTGFPDKTIDAGFRLQHHEAVWLRERWLSTADGSLLAHLARTSGEFVGDWAPWLEPQCRRAGTAITEVLDQAERFSLALAGGRLLYHLMVGERYRERGFERAVFDPETAREALDDWGQEVEECAELFAGWDSGEFWSWAGARNVRIDELTRRFFDLWFVRMDRGEVSGIADDQGLRDSVASRERFLKGGQARLLNDKLLAGWQGGLPTRVNFRWGQVSRLVTDLREGLQGDARP